VLGPLPDARFRRYFAHLDHGAVLALYTDGILERRSRSGELFGLARFQELLSAGRALSAAALVERSFDQLERFGDGGPPRDDATLLIVKRHG
jgi:sigma-B regulation protein RsbU (phosphoserine phosphatase)